MLPTPITYALRALSTFFPAQKPMVFSGAGSTLQLADLMIAASYKKPLLITDGFLLKEGMIDSFIDHVKENGCELTIFSDVQPNPTLEQVEKAHAISRQNNCDAVFAIGGGSVIDVSKVVAAASSSKRSIEKLAGILKVKQAPLPFYVVPTTSGSGSEVTNAAVISDTQTHKKQFFVDPKYVPLATALDPDILKTLPPKMTAAVGLDALTHALEAFTSRNNFPDTDRDASIAIKLLFKYLPAVYSDGNNLKAREMVAQASFLAGYAFSKSSLGYVHGISHQISAHYNTPHGLANAILLPRVLRFNKEKCAKRFARLETMLSEGATTGDTTVLAQRFIERVDDLTKTLEIPTQLPELQQSDFTKIAKDALCEAWMSYAVPKVMRKKDVEAILHSASKGEHVAFA